MLRSPLTASLICLATLCACQRERPAAAVSGPDDWAGVRTESPEPRLVIGEEPGFGSVADVAFDAAGNVYVLDGMAKAIRVFSPQGRALRTIGAPGHGPGEFEHPIQLAIRGDTLFVLDRRVQSFATDGSFVRMSEPADGDFGRFERMRASESGLMLQRTSRDRGSSGATSLEVTEILAYDPVRGGAPVSVVSLTDTIYKLAANFEWRRVLRNPPAWTVVNGADVAYHAGGELRVDIAAPDGTTRELYSASVPPVRTSQRDFDDLVDQSAKQMEFFMDDKTWFRQQVKYLRKAPREEYRPATGRLVAGDDDRLLIERPDLSDRPYVRFGDAGMNRWGLLSKDLQPATLLSLPSGFVPLALHACSLAGSHLDDSATPLVYVYDLDPALCPATASVATS